MKYVSVYATCGFLLAMVFHSALGLPSYFAEIFLIAAMLCLSTYLGIYRRGVSAASDSTPVVLRWITPLVYVTVVVAVVALCFDLLRR